MYVLSLSLSEYLTVLYSLFFQWHEMVKYLRDKVKWGEWCRPCDVGLGYHWPSDYNSKGGSFCSPDHGWLWATETMESEAVGKGGLLVCIPAEMLFWLSIYLYHLHFKHEDKEILNGPLLILIIDSHQTLKLLGNFNTVKIF